MQYFVLNGGGMKNIMKIYFVRLCFIALIMMSCCLSLGALKHQMLIPLLKWDVWVYLVWKMYSTRLKVKASKRKSSGAEKPLWKKMPINKVDWVFTHQRAAEASLLE